MQGTAEGDVHLLQSPADAEQRNAARHAGLDQRERHGIAIPVVGFVPCMRLNAKIGRMDIGTPAGQQDAVDRPQQGVDVGDIGRAGKHQGQRARDLGDRPHVALAHELHIVPVVDDTRVADDTDHRLRRARHSCSL